ncbi:MAG: general secretion pathway protein D [Kiritimatiellia bacterium]|jgi:general secretion pathway protein D
MMHAPASKWQTFLLILAGCCMFTHVASAQEDAPAKNGPMVDFNFPNVDIRSMVGVVQEVTGKRFVVGTSVTGKISVVTSDKIAANEMLPLFLSALESSGYTAVEKSGAYHIIRLAPSMVEAAPIVGPDEPHRGNGLIQRIFKLKHSNAADVRKVLEPLVHGGREGAITAFPPTNHLIITDTAEHIARLEKLINELDREGASGMMEVIQLKHASAVDVAAQVMAAIRGGENANAKVVAHMQRVAGEAGTLPSGLTIVPSQVANSLVIVGPPVQVEEAKKLITQLDIESAAGRGHLNAIMLKYLRAEDFAKSLNNLMTKSTTPGQLQRIVIEPDINNNALLVNADPIDFDYVVKLVDELDVQPSQVLVEVLIAEVATDDGLDLGVEWATIETPKDGSTTAIGRSRPGSADEILDLATQSVFSQGLSLGVARGTITMSDGRVVPRIPFLMRALAQERNVRIISKPALLARNNMEAKVSVVDNIPITESTIQGAGAANRDIVQNIKRMDVGLNLSITPQVNPNQEVTMKIAPTIEAIIDEGPEGTFAPTITKREFSTTVTVPDRSTVIISGLIREDMVNQESRVPVLGRLPLVGALFRTTTKRKQRTNLLVFVTPHVVTDMARAEERMRIWQQDTNLLLPEIEPRSPIIKQKAGD